MIIGGTRPNASGLPEISRVSVTRRCCWRWRMLGAASRSRWRIAIPKNARHDARREPILFHPCISSMHGNFPSLGDVGPQTDLTHHRGCAMQDPAKFREYAEECRRLARSANEKDRTVLLEIAAAWTKCAEEIEARTGGTTTPKT